MANENKAGYPRLLLTCGCCGSGFYTWPEYEDQDQDNGFGICAKCQNWMTARTNAELDDLAGKIRDALNPANREKFDAMSVDVQRVVAMKAIEDGLVTYSINR